MDVREYRCCMCPQRETDNLICPSGPGKDHETECDFVVVWTDAKGWIYKVMVDLTGTFRGSYCSGGAGWKGLPQLEQCESFDKAQEDLNLLAKSKGWEPYGKNK